jgi:TP901 family phage tail tape measure protein
MPELEEFIWSLRLIASTGGMERLTDALREIQEEGDRARETLEKVGQPIRSEQASRLQANITRDLNKRLSVTQGLRREVSTLAATASELDLFKKNELEEDRRDLAAILGQVRLIQREGKIVPSLLPKTLRESDPFQEGIKGFKGAPGLRKGTINTVDLQKGGREKVLDVLRKPLEDLIKRIEAGDKQLIKAFDALAREERILNQQLRERSTTLGRRRAEASLRERGGPAALEAQRRAQIRAFDARQVGQVREGEAGIREAGGPQQEQAILRLRKQARAERVQAIKEINQKTEEFRTKLLGTEKQISNEFRKQQSQAELILRSQGGQLQVSIDELRIAKLQTAQEQRQKDLAAQAARIRSQFGVDDPRRLTLLREARGVRDARAKADEAKITTEINKEEERRKEIVTRQVVAEQQISNELRKQRAQAEGIVKSQAGSLQSSIQELRISKERTAQEQRRKVLADQAARIRSQFEVDDPRRLSLLREARGTRGIQARADQVRIAAEINREEEKRIQNLKRIQSLLVSEHLQSRNNLQSIRGARIRSDREISNDARLGGLEGRAFEGAGILSFGKGVADRAAKERIGIESRIQDQIDTFSIEREQKRFDILQKERRQLAEINQAPDLTRRQRQDLSQLTRQTNQLNLAALDRQLGPTSAKIKVLQNEIRTLQIQTVNLRRISFDLATVSRNIFLFAASITVPLAIGLRSLGQLQIRLGAFNAIARQTEQQLAATQVQVIKIFENVPVSSIDELGLALFNIASANIDASKALDVLDVSARLAAIGMVETNVATKVLIQSLQAFQRDTGDSERTAEQLVTILNTSVGEFDEVGRAIGRASAAARIANQDLAELGGVFSVLTTAGGLTPRRAGEAANRLFVDLQRRRREIQDVLGFDIVEDNQIKNVDELIAKFAEMSNSGELNIQKLQGVFTEDLSKRTVSTLIDNVDDLIKTIEEIRAPTQTLQDAFERATSNVGSNLQLLSNRFQTLFIQAADAFSPYIKLLIRITDITSEIISRNKAWLSSILVLGAGFTVGSGVITALATGAVRLNLLRRDFQAFLAERLLGQQQEKLAQAGSNTRLTAQTGILNTIKGAHTSLLALENQRLATINAQNLALGRQAGIASTAGASSVVGRGPTGFLIGGSSGAGTQTSRTVSQPLVAGAAATAPKVGLSGRLVTGFLGFLSGAAAALTGYGLAALTVGTVLTAGKLALDGYRASVEKNQEELENSVKVYRRLSTRTKLSLEDLEKLEKAEATLLKARADVIGAIDSGAPITQRYFETLRALQSEMDANIIIRVTNAINGFFGAIGRFLFEKPIEAAGRGRNIDFFESEAFRTGETAPNRTRFNNALGKFFESQIPFSGTIVDRIGGPSESNLTDSRRGILAVQAFRTLQDQLNKALITGNEESTKEALDNQERILVAVRARQEEINRKAKEAGEAPRINLVELVERQALEAQIETVIEARTQALDLFLDSTQTESQKLRQAARIALDVQAGLGSPLQRSINNAENFRGELAAIFRQLFPGFQDGKIDIPTRFTDPSGILEFLRDSARRGQIAPIDVDLGTPEGIKEAVDQQAVLLSEAGQFARVTQDGGLQLLTNAKEAFEAAGALAFTAESITKFFQGGGGIPPGLLANIKDPFLLKQTRLQEGFSRQIEAETAIAQLTNEFGTTITNMQAKFLEERIQLVQGARDEFNNVVQEIQREAEAGNLDRDQVIERFDAAKATFILSQELATIKLQNEGVKIQRKIAEQLIGRVEAEKQISKEIQNQNRQLEVQIAQATAVSTADKLRASFLQFQLELEEARENKNESLLDLLKQQLSRGAFEPVVKTLEAADATARSVKNIMQVALGLADKAAERFRLEEKRIFSILEDLEGAQAKFDQSIKVEVSVLPPEARGQVPTFEQQLQTNRNIAFNKGFTPFQGTPAPKDSRLEEILLGVGGGILGAAIDVFPVLARQFPVFISKANAALDVIRGFFSKDPQPRGFVQPETPINPSAIVPEGRAGQQPQFQLTPSNKPQPVQLPQLPLPVTIESGLTPFTVNIQETQKIVEVLQRRRAGRGLEPLASRGPDGRSNPGGPVDRRAQTQRLRDFEKSIAPISGTSLVALQDVQFKDPAQNRFDSDFARKFQQLRRLVSQQLDLSIGVNEGFRTFEQQNAIRKSRERQLAAGKISALNAARAGTSSHEFGRAADITLSRRGRTLNNARDFRDFQEVQKLADQVGLSSFKNNVAEANHIFLSKKRAIPSTIDTVAGSVTVTEQQRGIAQDAFDHLNAVTTSGVSNMEAVFKELFRDFPGFFERIRQLAPFDLERLGESFSSIQTKQELETKLAVENFLNRQRNILKEGRDAVFQNEQAFFQSLFDKEAALFRSEPEEFNFRGREISFNFQQRRRELVNELQELEIFFEQGTKALEASRSGDEVRIRFRGQEVQVSKEILDETAIKRLTILNQLEEIRRRRDGESLKVEIDRRNFQIDTARQELGSRQKILELAVRRQEVSGRGLEARRRLIELELQFSRTQADLSIQQALAEQPRTGERRATAAILLSLLERESAKLEAAVKLEEARLDLVRESSALEGTKLDLLSAQLTVSQSIASLGALTVPGQEIGIARQEADIEIKRLLEENSVLQQERRSTTSSTERRRITTQIAVNEELAKEVALKQRIEEINSRIEAEQARISNLVRLGRITQEQSLVFQLENADLFRQAGESVDDFLTRNLDMLDQLRGRWVDHFNFLSDQYAFDFDERRQLLEAIQELFPNGGEQAEQAKRNFEELNRQRFRGLRENLEGAFKGGTRDLFVDPNSFNIGGFAQAVGGAIRGAIADKLFDEVIGPSLRPAITGLSEQVSGVKAITVEDVIPKVQNAQAELNRLFSSITDNIQVQTRTGEGVGTQLLAASRAELEAANALRDSALLLQRVSRQFADSRQILPQTEFPEVNIEGLNLEAQSLARARQEEIDSFLSRASQIQTPPRLTPFRRGGEQQESEALRIQLQEFPRVLALPEISEFTEGITLPVIPEFPSLRTPQFIEGITLPQIPELAPIQIPEFPRRLTLPEVNIPELVGELELPEILIPDFPIRRQDREGISPLRDISGLTDVAANLRKSEAQRIAFAQREGIPIQFSQLQDFGIEPLSRQMQNLSNSIGGLSINIPDTLNVPAPEQINIQSPLVQAAQLHTQAAQVLHNAGLSLQQAATSLTTTGDDRLTGSFTNALQRDRRASQREGGGFIPPLGGGPGLGSVDFTGIAPGILAAVPGLAFGGTTIDTQRSQEDLADEIGQAMAGIFKGAKTTGRDVIAATTAASTAAARVNQANSRSNARQIAGNVLAGLGVFQGGQAQGTPLGGGILGAITSVAGGLFGGGLGGGLIGGALGAIGGLFGSKKKKEPEKKEFPDLPEVEDVLFASRRFFQGSLEGGRQGLPIIRDQQTINDNKVSVTVENINVTGQNVDDIAKQIASKLKREMSQGFR